MHFASCIENAGSEVLQALTFFGTREKLNRAGYGQQTEAINAAAARIAREVAAGNAYVAGLLEIMLAAQASGRTGQVPEIESAFSLGESKKAPEKSEAAHRIHDRRRE